MNIMIDTDSSLSDVCIKIISPVYTEKSDDLVKAIQMVAEGNINEIVAKKDNNIYILKLRDISKIYSENGNVFIESKKEIYKSNKKLYELENALEAKGFIRISYSCLVNKEYISYFDASIIGELTVKLKDGSIEYISRRRVKDIMKMLKKLDGGKTNG